MPTFKEHFAKADAYEAKTNKKRQKINSKQSRHFNHKLNHPVGWWFEMNGKPQLHLAAEDCDVEVARSFARWILSFEDDSE